MAALINSFSASLPQLIGMASLFGVTFLMASLGAVAARALVVDDAAKAIIGTKLDDDAMAKLDAACQAAATPINDKRGTIEYRTKIAGVLARRAAKIAADRARSQ